MTALHICAPAGEAGPALTIGLLHDKTSRVHTRRDFASFGDLAEFLTTHVESAVKDGPAWVPADIEVSKPRKAEHATQWACLPLDIEVDKGTGTQPPDVAFVKQRLREQGLSGCVATTWTHTRESPRYRIILELSAPLAVEHVEAWALHTARLLGLEPFLDKKCFDASRLFFNPSCPAERWEAREGVIVEGKAFGGPPPCEDQEGAPQARSEPRSEAPPMGERPKALAPRKAAGVIGAFNEAYPPGVILERNGYKPEGPGRWTAPGSTSGAPGVHLLDCGERVYSHHGEKSDPLAGEHGHDAFSVFQILEHKDKRGAAVYAASALLAGAQGEDAEPGDGTRFLLLSGDDIRALPATQWVIKGIFPAQGVAQIFGPSKSGKSFLAMDMAFAIAEGGDREGKWFGYRVKQRPVVWVVLEGQGGVKARVAAWEKHNKRPMPEWARVMVVPFRLTDEKDVREFGESLAPGTVVYIDTQNQAAPGIDENSNKDMSLLLEGAKNLAEACGGLCVLLAHTGTTVDGRPRGHNSQTAAMDGQMEVKRTGRVRTWLVAKAKDGIDGGEHGFSLYLVDLGEDDDGDPVSSCVIDAAEKEQPRPKQMTGGARQAVHAYYAAADDGKWLSDGNGGVLGVSVTAWREAYTAQKKANEQGGAPWTKTNDKAIHKAWGRAIEELEERGELTITGGVARIVEMLSGTREKALLAEGQGDEGVQARQVANEACHKREREGREEEQKAAEEKWAQKAAGARLGVEAKEAQEEMKRRRQQATIDKNNQAKAALEKKAEAPAKLEAEEPAPEKPGTVEVPKKPGTAPAKKPPSRTRKKKKLAKAKPSRKAGEHNEKPG